MLPAPRRPRVLITAGGTREPIDDVRVVANSSTGRFGLALARAAVAAGAEVVLVGAAAMADEADTLPPSVRFVPYRAFTDLQAALDAETASPPDLVLMAAAVADYSPVPQAGKIRSDADALHLAMARNPKLLAGLRARCPASVLVGFKLLSGVDDATLDRVALAQLADNALDATVANDGQHLRGDRHPVRLVTADGVEPIDGPRDDVAAALITRFLPAMPAATPPAPPLAAMALPAWRAWRRLPPGARVHPAPRDPSAILVEGGDPLAPAVLQVDGQRWWTGPAPDADTLDAALAAGAPLLWHGHVVGAIRADGALVPVQGAHDAWMEDLLTDAPRWVVACDVSWAHRGWRPDGDPNRLLAPWGRTDTRLAASVLCWDVPTGRVLVGRRKRPPVGVWALPGGRAEPGEDALTTALRELEEETGLRPTHGPPAGSWVTWASADPCWRITALLLPVVLRPGDVTEETDELAPRWTTVRGALRLGPHTAGTRRVLTDLDARLARRGPPGLAG